MALTLSVPWFDWFTPLRIERHHPLGAGEQVVEAPQVGDRKIGRLRDRGERGGGPPRRRQRLVEAIDMRRDPVPVERAAIGQIHQQAVEQRHVAAGRERQMQVGGVGRRGAARIDGDDLRAARLARRHQALVQHRMAPGHVAADLDDEIGLLQSS